VNFEVSSTAPASKLIGFIKGETVEELVENGSDIEESVRAIENQKVRYVKTKNHGYRLVFADTRNILNLDAVAADAKSAN
jgi:predicted transcriptional regulator